MNEPLMVRRETQIAAPPATVFAFLTDPEKMLMWMGTTEARTELHPGGLFLLKGINGRVARGEYREVVPVHRLAYTFGWEDSEGGTLVRLTHSGLPNSEQCDGHAEGWAHYLGRLAMAAAGQDPGIDAGPRKH
jgi:uncharacterized protein YndB with AHSA1/START domain